MAYGKFEEPQLGYRERYVQDVCTKLGVFGVGQSNGIIQISVKPTIVAMATS